MLDGRYFEAHEILEIPWRGSRNARLQIAIWLAAAFVHWSKEEWPGTIKLLGRILDSTDALDLPIRDCVEFWITAASSQERLVKPRYEELNHLIAWGQTLPKNR